MTEAGVYHGPGLMGFVKRILEDDLSPHLWLSTPEIGVPIFTPGDQYSLVVYCLDSGRADLDRLLESLQTGKTNRADQQDACAFGPRWNFLAARDLFSHDNHRVSRTADLQSVTPDQIAAEASIWAAAGQAWFRLLSPMQLLRERDHRPAK
ncbi:MAG TPA: hypothetical protein VKA18_02225, partial [Alphaproteobacteria bacterium]|nr:hypothetical protein [Alphaproteobacteria bacterium]